MQKDISGGAFEFPKQPVIATKLEGNHFLGVLTGSQAVVPDHVEQRLTKATAGCSRSFSSILASISCHIQMTPLSGNAHKVFTNALFDCLALCLAQTRTAEHQCQALRPRHGHVDAVE